MTFAEMQERLDVLLDKSDLSWFVSQEKDIFLNFAVNEFVKKRYSEFETNEKRREDIRTLITSLTDGTGTSVVTLPSDFMFALSLKGVFPVTECGTVENKENFIRPIQHDDINKILEDPFNKPLNSNPVYISTSSTFAIQSETAPISWELVYIKTPVVVDATNFPNNTLDLPPYTHEEIVNLAVRKMLYDIGSPQYQVQLNEIQNQE